MAHGTATPFNDIAERTRGIKRVFFRREGESHTISGIKSMVGHCLGSAGGIEAVATVRPWKPGSFLLRIYYEVPVPFAISLYPPNQSIKKSVQVALSNRCFGRQQLSVSSLGSFPLTPPLPEGRGKR